MACPHVHRLEFRASCIFFCNLSPVLNDLAISLHMGTDFTGPSVDHRLRPIKRLAKMQELYVAEGKNPGDLPVDEKGKPESQARSLTQAGRSLGGNLQGRSCC